METSVCILLYCVCINSPNNLGSVNSSYLYDKNSSRSVYKTLIHVNASKPKLVCRVTVDLQYIMKSEVQGTGYILGECMALWGEPSVVIGCICATR